MTRRYRDSIIEDGANSTRIEEGRIINVNMSRWTVDVRTLSSQRTYYDVQWSNPYFHFAAGEGMFFMPEVGAKVKICRPADSDPFVLCFVTPFERTARQQDSDGDTPEVGTTSTDAQSDQPGGSDISFRAGRPNLQQGDMMIRTRDGNGIWFRRGGVLEVFSTAIARRLYIPLLNYIRDICENYDLQTAGGRLHWSVSRSDTDSDNQSVAVLTLLGLNSAEDDSASVMVNIGHVPGDNKLRIVVAPQAINTRTLAVNSTAVYELLISDDGKLTEELADDYESTIGGSQTWEVSGSVSYNTSGDFNIDAGGSVDIQAGGEHSLTAASSTERLEGRKVVHSGDINLGGSAVYGAVMASPALIAFIIGHTHSSTSGTTGPPTAVLTPDQFEARKVKVE